MCSSMMSFLLRIGLVRVDLHRAFAALRQAGDAHDVAFTLRVHVVSRFNQRQEHPANSDCSACPTRSRASCLPIPAAKGKCLQPSWRAARISFSSVTASRNHTTCR